MKIKHNSITLKNKKMKSIEERATEYCLKNYDLPLRATTHAHFAYIDGAKEQQKVDIEKFASYAEKFNKDCEKLGMEERIDVDSIRKWAANVILGSLNSEE